MQAQDNLPYKSLTEFRNDTTAFILYNFIDRAEQYKGKKLTDIAKDLEIPIKIIVPQDSRKNVVAPIYIYIWNNNIVFKMMKGDLRADFRSIILEWNEVEEDNGRTFALVRSEISEQIDFYNQFTIKNVSVVIPENSKYYEKYKPKETKSAVNYPRGLVRDENGELVSRGVIIDR